MTRKDIGVTKSLSQDWKYYVSYPGEEGSQASGAYIFRPWNDSTAYDLPLSGSKVKVEVIQGQVVTEVGRNWKDLQIPNKATVRCFQPLMPISRGIVHYRCGKCTTSGSIRLSVCTGVLSM